MFASEPVPVVELDNVILPFKVTFKYSGDSLELEIVNGQASISFHEVPSKYSIVSKPLFCWIRTSVENATSVLEYEFILSLKYIDFISWFVLSNTQSPPYLTLPV